VGHPVGGVAPESVKADPPVEPERGSLPAQRPLLRPRADYVQPYPLRHRAGRERTQRHGDPLHLGQAPDDPRMERPGFELEGAPPPRPVQGEDAVRQHAPVAPRMLRGTASQEVAGDVADVGAQPARRPSVERAVQTGTSAAPQRGLRFRQPVLGLYHRRVPPGGSQRGREGRPVAVEMQDRRPVAAEEHGELRRRGGIVPVARAEDRRRESGVAQPVCKRPFMEENGEDRHADLAQPAAEAENVRLHPSEELSGGEHDDRTVELQLHATSPLPGRPARGPRTRAGRP